MTCAKHKVSWSLSVTPIDRSVINWAYCWCTTLQRGYIILPGVKSWNWLHNVSLEYKTFRKKKMIVIPIRPLIMNNSYWIFHIDSRLNFVTKSFTWLMSVWSYLSSVGLAKPLLSLALNRMLWRMTRHRSQYSGALFMNPSRRHDANSEPYSETKVDCVWSQAFRQLPIPTSMFWKAVGGTREFWSWYTDTQIAESRFSYT